MCCFQKKLMKKWSINGSYPHFILIFSLFKELQHWNISCTSNFFALNDDKSNDSKEEHPENINDILLTLVVSNEDKSIDFKDLHA